MEGAFKMTRLEKATEKDKHFFLKTYNNKSTRYFLEDDKHLRKEWYKSIITRVSSLWFIIYNDKDQKVGLFNTFYKGDKYMFGIIITPEHRRKGYARDTIEAFLRITDKHNTDTYLECFEDNKALKLYKKLGYTQTNLHKTIRLRNFVEMKREFKS